MAEDFTLDSDSRREAETWWARRRRRYNIGLLLAGPLGFVFYTWSVSQCINLHANGGREIAILTIIFQGFVYLVVIGVANLCYYLAPWSERVVRPTNVAGYRRIAFRLGFWFSVVVLPLAPSALLYIICSLHAGEAKRVILG